MPWRSRMGFIRGGTINSRRRNVLFCPAHPLRRGLPLVRHYRRKRTYPTRNRVLIHLSGASLAPQERTQEGTAAAIRSDRSTVTKWLARLENRGLVARHRVRIPNRRVPVTAYHLTAEGWTEAASLLKRLASDVVTVRTPRLGSLSVRLAEVPRLASARLDLTSAVCQVNRGVLDLPDEPPSGGRAPAAFVWRAGFRDVDRLFGRDEERRKLDAWYASGSRMLVLTGSPGLGKSALLADWVRGRPREVAVYGFELRGSTTLTGLLSDFGAFLEGLGRPSLSAHLAQKEPVNLRVVQRLLKRDLAGLPILAVLDNADRAPRRTARLLVSLLRDVLPATPMKLILAGRTTPRWAADLRRPASPVASLRLRRLDPASSAALVRYRGVDARPEVVDEIVRTGRGLPMRLHLAVSAGPGPASLEEGRLVEEIWLGLPEEGRTALEVAALLRKPVAEGVLLAAAGIDPGTLEELAARNLLGRTAAGDYFLHDLVREFVARRIHRPRTRALHGRIAKPLLDASNPKERWEGVYHLLASGKIQAGATYLDSVGAGLLDSVAAEEIAALVRSLPEGAVDAASTCVFTEILGDALRTLGHVGPALRQYAHARAQAESREQQARVPRLLRKIAYIERCRNRYPQALGHLVESRARLSRFDDPVEKAEVLREMGIVEEALGDSAAAVRHLGEAVDLATETSDLRALSRGLLTLGTLETQHGHLDRGLDYDREGLRIAERSGALTEIAQAHIVLGADLAKAGRSEESVAECTLGHEIASRLGNLRLTAYATLNRASALLALRRYPEAAGPIKEAEGYFEILEERDTLAFLRTYEGQRAMGLGEWARADRMWTAGLDGLREYASPADFAHVLIEIAGFYLVHGEKAKARERLLEARGIARRLGSMRILSEVESVLAPLDGKV